MAEAPLYRLKGYATAPKVETGFNVCRRTILFLHRTVAREGIEGTQNSRGKRASAPVSGAFLIDTPDLLEVRTAWPTLAESERTAILALVRQARARA